MTGYETVMVEVLARLKASVPVTPVDSVRRAHRTAVPKDKSPATHLIDGNDEPQKRNKCGGREGNFTIAVFVRSDLGPGAADVYKERVYAKLAAAWPEGTRLIPGRIAVESEIADTDLTRIDMDFVACYDTAGEWAL